MKNTTSTLNRLFSKFFSFVLLLLVSLAPAINPITASGNNALIAPRKPASLLVTTHTVSNATPIAVGDNTANPNTVPYPSNITIAGAVGTITNVTVVLRNLTIAAPRDLDIVLVSPGGQRLVLLSDVGGVNGTTSNTVNATLTLSDGSPALPDDTATNSPLVTGTFRPTNNGAGEATFPAPGPSGLTTANYPANNPTGTACTGCAATFASVFAQPGVAANGVWSLFVDDDNAAGGTGTFATGWTLNVTVNDIPTTAANVSVGGRVVNSGGRAIANVKVGMLDPSGRTWYALTNPFGYFNFENVPAGETYVFSVKAKGYLPMSVSRSVNEDVADMEIVLQNE